MTKSQDSHIQKYLPEQILLDEVILLLKELDSALARYSQIAAVELHPYHSKRRVKTSFQLPVYKIIIGPEDRTLPTLVISGGVHGLERIGTQIVLTFLKTLVELLRFDEVTKKMFEGLRVIFFPMVNPGGVYLQTRSNPQGVDLMRNAPVEADPNHLKFLLSGHRISPRLPWFRGIDLELESDTLIREIKAETFTSEFVLLIDVHSGFGMKDQLWFPYARSKAPFPDIGKILAWKELLDRVYPHHVYQIEPQSLNYLTHGDLWDYLYDDFNANKKSSTQTFLPLCLEIGSWIWIKKNPLQIFSSLGPFNPMIPHRLERTLRRHNTLLDFLLRTTLGHKQWLGNSYKDRARLQEQAKLLWYHD